MSEVEEFVKRLLPIVSNLAVLLVCSRLLDYGHGQKSFWLFVAGIFTSPLYHLCIGFPSSCVWSLYKHKVMDFWTAELALPLIALVFIEFHKPYLEKWIILSVVIVVGLLVTGTNSTFFSQSVIGGTTLIVVAAYVLWHRFAHGYWPEYDLVQLSLGITFNVFGLCFFIVQDWWPPYYGYLHSFWHVFVFIGSFFLAGVRPPRPQILNLDTAIGSTSMQAAATSAMHRIAVAPNRVVQAMLPAALFKPRKLDIILPLSDTTAITKEH